MTGLQAAGVIVAIIVALLGLVGTGASLRAWASSAQNREAIGRLEGVVASFSAENQELRSEIEWSKAKAREREQEHQKEVAELRGQVNTLSGTLVSGLVERISTAVADALAEVLGRSEVSGL